MKQWLETYQHLNIYDALAALLVFFVPFSFAFPNIVLIPLGIVFLFQKKWKNLMLIKFKAFYIYVFLILFITLNIVIQGHIKESFDIISKFYISILFFLLFSIVKKKYWIEIAFLAGLIVSLLISVFNILSQYVNNKMINIDIGSQTNALLSIERPYLGFMIALGFFIIFKNIRKHDWSNWLYFLSLIFISFVIYISARLSLALILIITFHHLNHVFRHRRKLFYSSVIVFASIFVFAVLVNDNFRNRMRIKSSYQQTIKALKAYEPRYLIWPCALGNTAKVGWLTGTGGYDVSKQLQVNCYTENIKRPKKIRYYQTEAFNTHNQYLDFLLVSGLIPLILLLIFLITLLVNYFRYPLGMLSLFFLLFFLVENVLHRQLGVFIFGIFFGLYWPRLTSKSSNHNLKL